jgi:hypothetical protein
MTRPGQCECRRRRPPAGRRWREIAPRRPSAGLDVDPVEPARPHRGRPRSDDPARADGGHPGCRARRVGLGPSRHDPQSTKRRAGLWTAGGDAQLSPWGAGSSRASGDPHDGGTTMAIIHRTHRRRRPARPRRYTRPVVEAVEGRLALSSALPAPSPGSVGVEASHSGCPHHPPGFEPAGGRDPRFMGRWTGRDVGARAGHRAGAPPPMAMAGVSP